MAYKILSLDGGGSWAVLQLLTLQHRYKDQFPDLRGHDILREFDLVIANSGGSIVLAALAENLTITEAIDLFKNKANRDQIFKKNSFWSTFWPVNVTQALLSVGPRYSTAHKYKAFQKLFPVISQKTMDQLPDFIGKPSLKLVVCTFDALNNRTKFFRSHKIDSYLNEFVTLTQAIHGSSNAPVQYFDFPAEIKARNEEQKYYLWDGALGGFNNPVTAGVIEAINGKIPVEDMIVVSLGNGNSLMSSEQKEGFAKNLAHTQANKSKKWKFWAYGGQVKYFMDTVMNQAQTILFQPPDWSNYVAYTFLSLGKIDTPSITDRFIRLSPMIHIDNNTEQEAIETLKRLYELDMDLTKEEDVQWLFKCFELWSNGKIINQPIEYTFNKDKNLHFEKGDRTFEDGIKKWRQL